MQAFKLYFKILFKSAIWPIMLYVVIFLVVAMSITDTEDPVAESFKLEDSVKVCVFDNDSSELSENLTEYIGSISISTPLENDDTIIRDALFFEEVDYIITIPEGFSERFEAGEEPKLSVMQKPDSTKGVMLTSYIGKYLNTASIYLEGTGSIDYDLLASDMSISTETVIADNSVSDEKSALCYYMNYMAYPICACLIFSVSLIMLIINERDIRRRNCCSPINQTMQNIRYIFCNGILAAAVLLMLILIVSLPRLNMVMNERFVYYLINASVFTFASLCLAYMISSFSKKNMLFSVGNVIPLAFSFTGGVFVPQELLGSAGRVIGYFNPSYWYISANERLDKLSVFNAETLSPVLFDTAKVAGFGILFLAAALVVSKQRRTSAE